MNEYEPREKLIDADVLINDISVLVEKEDYFLTEKEQKNVYSALESIELSIKLLRKSMEEAPTREEQFEADTENWMRAQYSDKN